jgi:predicted nucleotidyltransferase
MNVAELAQRQRIFYTRAGSHAYGLATQSSDEDFRGVFIGLPDNLVGLHPVEHCEYSGDNMLYELRKFIVLAKDCNPNIIELLFMDESDILLQNEWWLRVKAQRELFLTRKAKFTFSGYAMAQLKKIRGHNRWLNDPQPVEPPQPAKYLKVKHIDGLSYEELVQMAQEYEQQLDELYKTSDLPHAPDSARINRLLLDIYRDYWTEHRLW